MNFRKLLTYLTVGTAAVIPFAGAQNPTILQGSYISNVFGNSNFVKNPNAQTNVANVTNATRSTTTPLVATSEFNLSLDAGQNATWTLRTFDAGMKGQNCEARFSYRGFATATTTAEIVQNSLVVAQLVLTPSTDPRIASINFPCGDLANATTFRIAQTTANMTGTNEIGGVYTGLATNMANVAQAEFVGSVNFGLNCDFSRTSNIYGAPTDASCTTTPKGSVTAVSGVKSGVTISNAKPGVYRIVFNASVYSPSSTNSCLTQITDGTTTQRLQIFRSNASQIWMPASLEHTFEYTSTGSRTIEFQLSSFDNASICSFENGGGGESAISVYRFPTSSELVVTPERQNWYVSASHTGANPNLGLVDITTKTEITDAALTLTPDTASQPVATLCSATNAPPSLSTSATTCAAGNESLGITFNIPSTGAYEVCAQFSSNTVGNAASGIDMGFSIEETATNANTALTSNKANARFSRAGSSDLNTAMPFQQCNNILFSSIGQKAVRLMYQQGVTPTVLTNIILADNNRTRAVAWTVRPLTNQSNSALYVQGPVLAAATGAAIPEGYVNEFSTRSISDTSSRQQSSPVLGTFYYPWTSTLTLPAGNWLLCYKALIEQEQTVSSSAVAYPRMHIQNQTDSSIVMTQSALGQITSAPFNINYIWSPVSQCKPIAITSSKTFRMGIAYGNSTGTASVLFLRLRGDVSETELYAIRLN
jgi:hypothetical protein